MKFLKAITLSERRVASDRDGGHSRQLDRHHGAEGADRMTASRESLSKQGG